MLVFLLMAGVSAYIWSLINVYSAEKLAPPIEVTDIPLSGHSKTMNPNEADDVGPDQMDISEMLDEELKLRSKCEQFSYELPKFKANFFGRDESIEEITSMIMTNSVSLLNINGPLGCGKSQLAVQVGYRLLDENLFVSYIDMSDRKFDQFIDNARKESLPIVPPIVVIDYPISDKNYSAVHNVSLVKELSNWSKTLNCPTILILDNCDSIRDNVTFVRFIKSLIISSNHRLKVIATSRKHVGPAFQRWTISELSMDSSLKLLNQVAPSVDRVHLDRVLALLGGCPLALKITGSMLEHSRGHVDAIFRHIERSHLNRVSGSRQQFLDLVSIVYEFLPLSLRACGHYLYLFPGSFDKVSGENVITALDCEDSIGEFLQRALLDEYTNLLADENRLKMPSLVKDYFKENNQPKINNRQKLFDKKEFKKKFSMNYIDLFVLEIMNPWQLRSPDQYNLKFSTESHNIQLLINIIFTHRVPSSMMYPKEMAVLAPLTLQGWIPFHKILNHYQLYKQLFAELRLVCKFLPGSRCINFYSQLISDVYYSECNNKSVFFSDLIHVIVYGKRNCGALFMNGTRISSLHVWNQLSYSIQSFIFTARILSFKYLVWVLKAFGFAIVIVAYVNEFFNLSNRNDDTQLTAYMYFIIFVPATMFALGMFILYATGNYDLAVLLHIYMPSTLFILVLLLCCCYGSIYCLVFSYLFRMWCVILFLVGFVKLFFWLYSTLAVPLSNVILL